MNPMRFEIHPASGGWRVHYQNVRNGKLIFWTQVYNDLRDAERAIQLARLYARSAPVDRSLLRKVLRTLRRAG